MDPVSAAVVGAVVRAGAARLRTVALGRSQQRALEIAIRDSAAGAARTFPRISDISAEIDPLADAAAAEELLAAAVERRHAEWPAADSAWRNLYGSEPAEDWHPFLAALASDLGDRIRGHPDLQPVFQVHAVDLLLERSASLETSIAALRDPVTAIKLGGDEFAHDFELLANVIGEAWEAARRGPLGQAADILAHLSSEGGAHLSIKPKAGPGQLTLRFSLPPPLTPEEEVQYREIDAAVRRGEDVQIPRVMIRATAGGTPIHFPEGMAASSGPTRTRRHALLEFRSTGLGIERVPLELEAWMRADGTLVARSPADSHDLVAVDFEAADGRATANFRSIAPQSTVREQLKATRLAAMLERGCRITLWFADTDTSLEVKVGPDARYAGSAGDAQVLALFVEVQRRAGVEVGQVNQLTPQDVADLHFARDLLTRGHVPLGRGTTMTLTTTKAIAEVVEKSSIRRGTISVTATEDPTVLVLSQHSIPLGPTTTRATLRWPPKDVRIDGESYTSVFDVVRGTRSVGIAAPVDPGPPGPD